MLRSFRALGVWIALDDFGVGYCSLAALRDLSLDVLEIDAGSIQGLTGPNADDRLMRAIIQMAQVLGLDVVAGASSGPTSATGCWRSVANAGRVFVFSSARTATALRAQAAGSADLPLPGLG